ncbi:ABC transporter permease [Canibacter oris]|uniref:Transport permease protein n=1 Tax=Canibacter oris TaxID=1365628 RepID=A0A840DQM4_9MICO|nr:ABC-2 type transport system permease protein [Canibacter oris]
MTTNSLAKYRNDPDYSTPGKSRGLIDVFTHRYLLQLLTNKGVATRYYGSVLGWIWSYIKPGAQFLMYYLVIGLILGVHRGIDWFHIYLFTGIVMVNLFSEIMNNTTTSVLDNGSLVSKIFLPRELFPVSACAVAIIHFFPQVLLLFAITLFSGWVFSWGAVLAFIGALVLTLSFALGLGMFFGSINALYRDAKNFVDLLLMFATWASPVLYSFEMVRDAAPSWFYHLYMSNPLTVAVELFHDAFWAPLTPESARPENFGMYTLIAFAIAFTTLLIGQLTFRKLEASFAQRL